MNHARRLSGTHERMMASSLAMALCLASSAAAAQSRVADHAIDAAPLPTEVRCRGGEPDACTFAGSLYEFGAGPFARDTRRAEALFDVGCRAGSTIACWSLANLLEGQHGATHEARAMRAFARACDDGRGDPDACLRVADDEQLRHPGSPRRPAHARALLARACAQGGPNACALVDDHDVGARGADTTPRRLAPDVVASVVAAHLAETARCRDRAAPGVVGEFGVGFVIARTGAVVGAAVLDANLDAPAVEACVLHVVRRWRFPTADGHTLGTAIVPVHPVEARDALPTLAPPRATRAM